MNTAAVPQAPSVPRPLTPQEKRQLEATAETFEGLVKQIPNDYQALEILKEAYERLGRPEDVLRVSKQLAAALEENGMSEAALAEYRVFRLLQQQARM